MTITEAYEAIMKMPCRYRIPDFREAGRKAPKDAKAAGSGGDMLGEVYSATSQGVLAVITDDT